MKKFILIGSIIFCVGVLVFMSSLAALGWDITKLSSTPPYEEKVLSIVNNHQDIDVVDENVAIVIKKSTDAKIHFTYYENEKESYDLTQTDTISLIKNNKHSWYDYIFNIPFHSSTLTIELPEQYSGNLNIKTSNNNVAATNISAANISIMTSNVSIEINNVNANGSCVFSSTNGNIKAQQLNATKADFKTSNGIIDLSNVSISGDANIKTSNNKIIFNKLSVKGDLDLETSNGAITGKVAGEISDFSINSITSNGTNNLPNSILGEQLLSVKTSNNRIEIYFE